MVRAAAAAKPAKEASEQVRLEAQVVLANRRQLQDHQSLSLAAVAVRPTLEEPAALVVQEAAEQAQAAPVMAQPAPPIEAVVAAVAAVQHPPEELAETADQELSSFPIQIPTKTW